MALPHSLFFLFFSLILTPSIAWAWISSPHLGDEQPPTLCVLRHGLNAYYVEERIELQQRHGSWTLYWHASRPKGFKQEERVALLTEEESHQFLLDLATKLSSSDLITQRQVPQQSQFCPPPPIMNSRIWGVQTTISLFLSANEHPPLTLLQNLPQDFKKLQKKQGLWLQWPLGDIETQLNPSAEQSYALIEQILSRYIQRPYPIDQLLIAQEQGLLLIKLNRPARLEVDGVNYGFPTVQPIPVSIGLHTLSLYPLSAPFGPFHYRQIEVEQGKLTRLSLTLE